MRAALVQLNSSDDPQSNLVITENLIREAAGGGAEFVVTPECTNLISLSRERQGEVLTLQSEDRTLKRLCEVTRDMGITLLIGSLCIRAGSESDRFVNRSFLIGPDGEVKATYDKIHMFDVDLPNGDSYRESARYRPGNEAVLASAAGAPIGMTICYDMRFPYLYRGLAKAGASVITVPSAFTVPTGEAHWHVLLRARAIETGCFVLAPAQTGTHAAATGPQRQTYGHSLAVGPWGEVIADAGTTENTVTLVDLDLNMVEAARARIPSLEHDRVYEQARKT